MRKKIRTRKFIYAIMPVIGMACLIMGFYVRFVGFLMWFGFPLIFAGLYLYYRELEKEGTLIM
jgi:hypothetical protein